MQKFYNTENMQAVEPIITVTSPRGTITLPKKLRDRAGLPKQAALAVSYDNGRFILEPLTNAPSYPHREYTDKEIAQFLEDDKLDPRLAKKLDKKFGFKPFSAFK